MYIVLRTHPANTLYTIFVFILLSAPFGYARQLIELYIYLEGQQPIKKWRTWGLCGRHFQAPTRSLWMSILIGRWPRRGLKLTSRRPPCRPCLASLFRPMIDDSWPSRYIYIYSSMRQPRTQALNSAPRPSIQSLGRRLLAGQQIARFYGLGREIPNVQASKKAIIFTVLV